MRLWLFSYPLLSLIPNAVLKGVKNLMFFLPQSVARLPPIGFSYLEHLGFPVKTLPCKISIFQAAKKR